MYDPEVFHFSWTFAERSVFHTPRCVVPVTQAGATFHVSSRQPVAACQTSHQQRAGTEEGRTHLTNFRCAIDDITQLVHKKRNLHSSPFFLPVVTNFLSPPLNHSCIPHLTSSSQGSPTFTCSFLFTDNAWFLHNRYLYIRSLCA